MIHYDSVQGHSAEVRLELNVGERVIRLAKSGPGYAVLREPASVPTGDATLVAKVDGRLHRREVVIMNATSIDVPFDDRVEFKFKSAENPEHGKWKQLGLFE